MGTHLGNWIDRAVGYVAPQYGLRRARARVATDILARHYEGASTGRRTQGWRRTSGDANAVAGPALVRLREAARDLVRNNGYAESALSTITDHIVGWGITAKPRKTDARALAAWTAWADSTDCDADGRNNFSGLQRLVVRTIVESGEVLIRRRIRRPEDGLAVPLQLQVLEPDYLDTLKTQRLQNGGAIINGIEFNVLGQRVAYWLFKEHPGAAMTFSSLQSQRIPAESIRHVYRHDRPGQERGVSWFAPVLLKFKDFDDYDDATLMKQKIAACLAVMVTDVDGTSQAMGTVNGESGETPEWEGLEPGGILYTPPGRSVTVVQPPTVREHPDYSRITLRGIATGLGVTYEDMTGDYVGLPFSAARMSRLRHWGRVNGWRWHVIIPQFCDPAWSWFMTIGAIAGEVRDPSLQADWTPPPPPMVDPQSETTANRDRVRSGQSSLSEVLRELGYDPKSVFSEIAADNALMDKLGLVLDSDPRKVSAAGLTQARPQGTTIPATDVGVDGTVGDAGAAQPAAADDGGDA